MTKQQNVSVVMPSNASQRLLSNHILGLFFILYTMTALNVSLAHAATPNANDIVVSRQPNVYCGSNKDSWIGVKQAFASVSATHQKLLIDCSLFIHVGSDISRQIYIEDDSEVEMLSNVSFTVDNSLVPVWVIANSSRVSLENWHVRHIGSDPIDLNTGGYYNNGKFIPSFGRAQPSAQFSDQSLTNWLTKHRNIRFIGVKAPWAGPTGTSAIFYIVGSASEIHIRNMRIDVPPRVTPDKFVLTAFFTGVGWRDGEVVTDISSQQRLALPTHVYVNGLILDGVDMGWLGGLQFSNLSHITSLRYGDLQTSDGQLVGGVSHWFAPPHLLYFPSGEGGGPRSHDIKIGNIDDRGDRAGRARDQGGVERLGYAASIKIGADNSSIEDFLSARPDGALDIQTSKNLTISKVKIIYNSKFLLNIYPAIRFVQGNLKNVRLSEFLISDSADISVENPVESTFDPTDENLSLTDFEIHLNAIAPGFDMAIHAGSATTYLPTYKIYFLDVKK